MFIIKDQNCDGGWSSMKGSFNFYEKQESNDKKEPVSDAATTAIVSMAILRSGSDLEKGKFSIPLRNGLDYILRSVEKPEKSVNLSTHATTQIQMKLGNNIDCILSAQFLGNILNKTAHDPELQTRVEKNLQSCLKNIQDRQNKDGSMKGQGWAGVLQSGFANSALETASKQGIEIDLEKFEKSKTYNIGNYNPKTNTVNTDLGAGIVLYSVSGSVRASASDAKKVKKDMQKAIDNGVIQKDQKVTAKTLQKIGYSQADAAKSATAYQVNEEAKNLAQQKDIITGFGNNGGEEFLSFLQTGESLIISGDDTWKNWYEKTSTSLLEIQNENGSWNGHHCITSPSFCTATCLLILSIENDINSLTAMGND
ncbi:MAG: hypothetical protein AAF487_13765, partial [Bacteroidota bacterium]